MIGNIIAGHVRRMRRLWGPVGLLSNCRAREDGFRIEGYQAQPDEQVVFLINAVSANYFSTVGMHVVAGRALNDGFDDEGGSFVMAIS